MASSDSPSAAATASAPPPFPAPWTIDSTAGVYLLQLAQSSQHQLRRHGLGRTVEAQTLPTRRRSQPYNFFGRARILTAGREMIAYFAIVENKNWASW